MRKLLTWVIVIAVPVVLVMGMARLLTLPWYPAWQYGRASFPPDPLGMSQAQRLELARACIDFLNYPQGARPLEPLRLPGDDVAFNAREIRHMDDVKRVYNGLTWLAAGAFAGAVAAGWLLARRDGARAVWPALLRGSALTLVLLLALGLWMLVGFQGFFTAFHGIFFEGDTWLFAYDDTLIRLFPLPFWRDAGLLIAAGVAAVALMVAALGWHSVKKEQNDGDGHTGLG